MGASLNPEYFEKNINLALMVGPVASTANIPSKYLQMSSKFVEPSTYIIKEILHDYNLVSPMPLASTVFGLFCSTFTSLCESVVHWAAPST
jgi:hypothetical protein